MPPYEITLFTRPLAKLDLIKALENTINTILNNGAVVKSIQSLGHRDIPVRQYIKEKKEQVYATNSILVNCYMSIKEMEKTRQMLLNNMNVLRFGIININDTEPIPKKCHLEDLLKPPAYRKSVEDLRLKQKLGHFSRQRIFKRTEKEWKTIPKSYTISPPRK